MNICTEEIIYELNNGMYNLFVEGFLNTADPDQFYELISSPLYTRAYSPVLVVKNLSISKKCALLCADSVAPKVLVEKSMAILGDSSFSFDIVYCEFQKNGRLVTLGREEGGSSFRQKNRQNVVVLSGTPE